MIFQVLDITRTVARVGCGLPTGIDRVERAYISEFLNRFPNALFLAKLTRTFVVINAEIMYQFVGADFGSTLKNYVGMLDAARFKLPRAQRRARSFLRRNALWLFRADDAKDAFINHVPDGFEYTNVGHSNLGTGFLSHLKPAGCSHIRILIHDMIPLDFPQYCKDKTPDEFRAKMQSVAVVADEIICNSEYTRTRVQEYFNDWPNNVSYTVARLGVENTFTVTGEAKSNPASFVILGTIEPRKNHSFLLDVWEELSKTVPGHEMPVLHIVGKRGWENDAFFERLEASTFYGTKIIEHTVLGDAELNRLMGSAGALLFPSLAEGYGLPAMEARAAGLPIICSDIPVFKELLNNSAYMISVDDCTAWAVKILEITREAVKFNTINMENKQNIKIPCWPAHFSHILGE